MLKKKKLFERFNQVWLIFLEFSRTIYSHNLNSMHNDMRIWIEPYLVWPKGHQPLLCNCTARRCVRVNSLKWANMYSKCLECMCKLNQTYRHHRYCCWVPQKKTRLANAYMPIDILRMCVCFEKSNNMQNVYFYPHRAQKYNNNYSTIAEYMDTFLANAQNQ